MNKMDSTLNNLQCLIYHKTQSTNQPTFRHLLETVKELIQIPKENLKILDWTFHHCYWQASEKTLIRGALDKFPDFFRMGTFIDSTHVKL